MAPANRDLKFANVEVVLIERINFVNIDGVRTVHSDKFGGGKPFQNGV